MKRTQRLKHGIFYPNDLSQFISITSIFRQSGLSFSVDGELGKAIEEAKFHPYSEMRINIHPPFKDIKQIHEYTETIRALYKMSKINKNVIDETERIGMYVGSADEYKFRIKQSRTTDVVIDFGRYFPHHGEKDFRGEDDIPTRTYIGPPSPNQVSIGKQ